ncbi:hypothetical protein NC652_033260 [Populus alba x Populus x berolinensis]|nr:hypothetical protein NC652_033260 [Populus alba x Populus x berolinensis]
MQYTPALSSSLQLLHSYGSGITKLNANQPGSASDETCFGSRKKLSTEEIIRVAGSMFIQFSEALRRRIDKARGRFPPTEMKGKPKCVTPRGFISTRLAHLSVHQKVPINQVMQLTAIQAINENVGSARKIHLIDLEIRSGVQWTALME